MSVNINHQLEQVNNLKITPVGTGATVGTAGIVTYYGDGSQLSGISGGGSSVWSTSGNDAYYTTGNVGIATDGPTAKLDVRGTLNVTGVSTFQDDIHLLFGDQLKFYGSPSTQLNLEIYDSNVHAYVAKRAGSDLILVNHVNNKDVVIQSDNGSGSFTDYYRADGSSGESILYHYGSQKLATKSDGIVVSGIVTANSFVKSGGTSSQYLMADGSVSTGSGCGGGGSADPVGTIVAWAGTVANIPSDYQLCDGTAADTSELAAITGANVPDLRDRFIIGATDGGDGSYPGIGVSQTGGSANAVLIAHSHTHNRATYRTLASGGAHGAELSNVTTDNTSTVGEDNAGNPSTTQTGTNANLPPYYALCYIIKHTATSAGGGTPTTRSVNNYTATAGQTLFPPSGTVPYTVGYIDVYLNGSKLDSSEFTASNGTTVTLTTGASLNDIVELVAYENVSINDVTVINDTTPQLGGELDINNHDITGTGNMNITGIATANGGQLQTESDVIALAIALG